MGRKKHGRADDTQMWIPKKPKIGGDVPLSHLAALMQYTWRMKLGQTGFKMLEQPPPQGTSTKWVVRAVIGEDEMGYGEGPTRDAAMNKAALVCLHLFDPVGKSLAANLGHPDPAAVAKLAKEIEEVKPEDIAAARGGSYAIASNPSIMPPGHAGLPPQLGGPMGGAPPGPMAPPPMGMYGYAPPPMPYGYPGMPPPMPMPGMPMPGMMPGMMPPRGFMPPGPPGWYRPSSVFLHFFIFFKDQHARRKALPIT
mmetsp:Transcript_52815/g.120384  ORF Transcript_52815/g.120384 Transcript_52815/m.120384 type:complete len:253 (-) Transcript_52815:111-869(-)